MTSTRLVLDHPARRRALPASVSPPVLISPLRAPCALATARVLRLLRASSKVLRRVITSASPLRHGLRLYPRSCKRISRCKAAKWMNLRQNTRVFAFPKLALQPRDSSPASSAPLGSLTDCCVCDSTKRLSPTNTVFPLPYRRYLIMS